MFGDIATPRTGNSGHRTAAAVDAAAIMALDIHVTVEALPSSGDNARCPLPHIPQSYAAKSFVVVEVLHGSVLGRGPAGTALDGLCCSCMLLGLPHRIEVQAVTPVADELQVWCCQRG